MTTAIASVRPRVQTRHLFQEAAIFLTVSYVLLLGGTFNGLVLYRLNLASLVVIALLGVLWLGWRWLRAVPFPRTSLDAGLAALLAAEALATVTSVDPRRSLGALLLLALYVLAFYLLADLLRAGWPAGLFIRGLLFASSFVVAFGLIELLTWYAGWLAIGGWQHLLPPATLRVRAFLGHPNFVAALFSLLLPLGLVVVLTAHQRLARVIAAAWVAAAAVLVFFTSSRSGWLGTAAGIGVLALLLGRGHWRSLQAAWRALRRRPWLIASLAVLALVLLAGAAALVYEQLQHPTHSGRDYIWDVAWAMLQRSPLTGNGPFTFGTEFIRHYPVPPEVLLPHAHSYYINTAAEAGLLGAAALAVLGVGLVRALWVRWRAAAGPERLQLAGLIAGLVGLAVTSLFDTPQTFPALAVFGLMLAALAIASPQAAIPPGPRPRPALGALWPSLLLTAGWLLACGGLAWSLRAYQPFSQGALAANLGRWAEAAPQLDEAASRDPRLAFYWLQAGFAHGQAALAPDGSLADPAQLQAALADYERGIALEPTLTTNWANLAVLRWAAGDQSGAVQLLEKAVVAASEEAPLRLTLGKFYESLGQADAARSAFAGALALRPDWLDTYFFRATPLRQEVAATWLAQHPAGWHPGDPAALAAAWAALQGGRFEDARLAFQSAGGLNTPEPYLGLGLAYIGEADYPSAERALRTAQFVPGLSGYTDVLIRFALGRLASARGQPAAAVAAYEDGLAKLAGTTSFGVGLIGNSDYGWYVFNRESIQPDLLPGLAAAPPTDEAVQAMLALADNYQSLGDLTSAQIWNCRARNAAPDNSLAQTRAAAGACPPAGLPSQP